MTKQAEQIAHNELVGGSQTSLHSHVGGGGGLVDKGGLIITDSSGEYTVSFNTNYGSLNYFIQLTSAVSTDAIICNVKSQTKSISGFTIITMDDGGKAEPNVDVYWCTGSYSNP